MSELHLQDRFLIPFFLARLGDEVLAEGDGYAVTRRRDGTLAVLMWNYCHYRADANDSRLLPPRSRAKSTTCLMCSPRVSSP